LRPGPDSGAGENRSASADCCRFGYRFFALADSRAAGTSVRMELASHVKQKAIEKFDGYLSDELLTFAFARERIDVSDLPLVARKLLDGFRDWDITAADGQ
jgi:hypothetical protein